MFSFLFTHKFNDSLIKIYQKPGIFLKNLTVLLNKA